MAVMEANRRLAVILSADIVGYSRLMALDEDGTVQTLATYQEVIAALVGEHAGRVKKGPVKKGTNFEVLVLATSGDFRDCMRHVKR